MKKKQIIALFAFVATGLTLSSCGSGVTTKVALNKDIDTISYAYGATLSQQGLVMHLQQVGILKDTSSVRYAYMGKLNAAKGDKKVAIQKEIRRKVDSINSANKKNITEFLKGLSESVKAPASKSAYLTGLAVGGEISKQMFPMIVGRLYGQQSNKKINKDAFIAAIATAMTNGKLQVPDSFGVLNSKMEKIRKQEEAKQEAALKIKFKDQLEKNQKFLADNKTKHGVVTLPSGVQYKIKKQGKGSKPKATDVVKVNYKGTLIDGTVFDSSFDRKAPASFNVSGVIKGWTEVLQLMPVGSKWTIYVPYNLAYGSQDRGKIKPFSTLIFDVELLSIEAAKK